MDHCRAICVDGFKFICILDYEILTVSDDSTVYSDQTADVIYLDDYVQDNVQYENFYSLEFDLDHIDNEQINLEIE